jgi:hypothetical protein
VVNIWARRSRRKRLWGAAGILITLSVAVALGVAASAGAGKHRLAATDQFLKATYSPVKLHAPGDPQEIRYDISCVPPDGNLDGPGLCDGSGTVYFRSSANVFATVQLRLDPSAKVGRYVASVPSSIWNAPWFSYYAVLRDNATGRTITMPQGGSNAPQLSFAIGTSSIDLGEHVFGATRQPDARVAGASWGTGDGQVGLEDGIDMPAGGASFDVDAAGDVYLLDEANSRMLEFAAAGGSPTQTALPGLVGVRGDLRVAGGFDTAYVLEVANAASSKPILSAYTLGGISIGTSAVADSTAAQLRVIGSTAYVSEYPSSVWAPVMQNNGRTAVDRTTQVASGAAGAPSSSGNLVVMSLGNEVRVGTYSSSGTTLQLTAARVTSTTPVADIQLVQRFGAGRMLIVFSVYTDSQHEYEAVVVDSSGSPVDQFSLPAAEWALSMPLSRFRLVGSSLYELGSTDSGVFVDRFDLGV